MKMLWGNPIYVVSTFVVQATSHFAINKAHYASVTFLRPKPIFILGILSMLVQGLILSYFYRFYSGGTSNWAKGWKYGLLMGAFFASYSVLAEPAKYLVPSVPSWMITELAASFVQFSLFGVGLGWVLRTNQRPVSVT